MTIKKEYCILVVIIAILAVYIYLHKSNEMHYQLPELPQLKTEDITKLQISQPENDIGLKQSNGQWTIEPEGFTANKGKIQKLLAPISDLSLTALASTSKTYNRYGLSKSKRIQVKAWQGDKLVRSFYVGKSGKNHSTAFVKLTDDPNIYVVSSNLKNKFSKNKEELRDKTVLTFDPKKIKAVTLNHKNKQMKLQKVPANKTNATKATKSGKSYLWATKGKTVITSKKVDKLLQQIADLHCSKYLDNKSHISDLEPIYTISLKNKSNYSLKLYQPESKENKDKGQNRYSGTSSDCQYSFTLAQYTGKQIVKTLKSLLQETNGTGAK